MKSENNLSFMKFWITTLCTVFVCNFFLGQSLHHPCIWVKDVEKSQLLEKIDKYGWAKSIVDQLHRSVDGKLAMYQTNPDAILNMIPDFQVNDGNSESMASSIAAGHFQVLTMASYAGMLYYLTEDEKYAQFAADILAYYINVISDRTPETTTICGNYFFDPRTTYPHFSIAYDFIYNYLKKPGVTVYDKATGTRVAFDNAKAQKAIKNMVGNALAEYLGSDTYGKTISNHPVLTAPGALFLILCVEDDAERERLFNVFWETGTKRQNSFKNTILPMFGEQGIWPESLSYSFMPNISLILNVIDRIKPGMNVTVSNQNIFGGVFLFENLRYPDRRFVRYGDSKRNNDSTEPNYLYVLNIAKRRGYTELEGKAEKALKQYYDTVGGRKPKLSSGIFGNYKALELFWGEPLPDSNVEKFDYKPTVIIKHAGMALQRNYVDKDNQLFGLCGIIGGGSYVHSHCTGITMELYGSGYVMSPNAGLPPTVKERRIPLHENYFRLYAGNNTVIVNGSSHGLQEGSWKDQAYVWQNTAVNIASEPKHLGDPVSRNFSFATQFLGDKVNNCNQERTLSTIRTSPTTAYYFDMFRSKSLDENKFQDYIYHNIGDETEITNTQNEPLLLRTTNNYQNDIGDPVHSPGWRYFENTMVTKPTKDAIKVNFHVKYDNRYMHLFVPKGIAREYTKALAPPTREALNGYVNKKTQVLAIRQQGEAWNRPFISILEPGIDENASVQSVEQLTDGSKVVGAKVISKVGEALITDYIICQDKADAFYLNKNINLQFKGRFGIVRITEENEKKTYSLYIGEGKKLSFEAYNVVSDNENKAFETFN